MFGGQDDTTPGAQGSPGGDTKDDTLNGVADLISGTTVPSPTGVDPAPAVSTAPKDPTFMPMPAPANPAPSTDDVPTPAAPEPPKPVVEPAADPTPAPAAPADASDDNDELLDIKQQALQQLSPLVGQLDQTPEEKFRTTMMLIQAADNRDLLKDAYEAAQNISDEKERAQALLDVINEINYFTQPKSQD